MGLLKIPARPAPVADDCMLSFEVRTGNRKVATGAEAMHAASLLLTQRLDELAASHTLACQYHQAHHKVMKVSQPAVGSGLMLQQVRLCIICVQPPCALQWQCMLLSHPLVTCCKLLGYRMRGALTERKASKSEAKQRREMGPC